MLRRRMVIEVLGWVALGLAIAAATQIIAYGLWIGITPNPSSRAQRTAVLSALPERPLGPIYELGAGFGGLAFALADRFPQVPVVAFELSWVPWAVLRLRQALFPRRNLTVLRADFLRAPLGEARVWVCYLFRGAMQRLGEKLLAEASSDGVLVTHTFSVPGWVPRSTARLDDLYRTPVFAYAVSEQRTPPA